MWNIAKNWYFVVMGVCLMVISYLIGQRMEQEQLILLTGILGTVLLVSVLAYSIYQSRKVTGSVMWNMFYDEKPPGKNEE
jgi:hypothetical protein